MTKNVRIENADTSDHKVQVSVEEKNADGQWVRTTTEAVALPFPTSMMTGMIHGTRRLVVEEAP